MKITRLLSIFVGVFAVTAFYIQSVYAQSCSWLPAFLCDLVSSEDPLASVQARVQAGFYIAIGVIILIAIAYGIYMAYKYIPSGGDEGGMEESNKGMRAILFGIGSIFVIMIGITVVLLFFGVSIIDLFPRSICINEPNSIGCYACKNAGVGDNREVCDVCDSYSGGSTSYPIKPNGDDVLYQVDPKTGEYLKITLKNDNTETTGELQCDQEIQVRKE